MLDTLRGLYQMVSDLRHGIERDALDPQPTSAFSLFGDTPDRVMARFAELEPKARKVWNMQPLVTFDPDDPSFELNERSWRRGVDSLIITSQRTMTMNPIMMIHSGPRVWVGPALIAMMLVNDHLAIVEGPRGPTGSPTVMWSSRPEAAQLVRSIFDQALAASRQVYPPGTEPLSRRQIQVARGMARGRSDRLLARDNEVSVRTIEREVAAILRVLETGSRTEAISRMSGRKFGAKESGES